MIGKCDCEQWGEIYKCNCCGDTICEKCACGKCMECGNWTCSDCGASECAFCDKIICMSCAGDIPGVYKCSDCKTKKVSAIKIDFDGSTFMEITPKMYISKWVSELQKLVTFEDFKKYVASDEFWTNKDQVLKIDLRQCGSICTVFIPHNKIQFLTILEEEET